MKFSDKVLTKAKSGKVELRAVDSKGKYVICKYLDPSNLSLSDKKRKLCLKSDDGKVEEYFIVPLKDQNRALLIKAKKQEKEVKVWNEKAKKEESLW